MTRRLASILFKALLVAGCLLGIILTVRRTGNALASFSYYTLQSNAVCLVLFATLAVREARSPGDVPTGAGLIRFKGACTLYILITLMVYHFLLVPQLALTAPGYQAFSLSDVLVHYITPLMVFADYLLFDRKGRFRALDPLIWSLLPLSYLSYVFVYVSLGGRFGAKGSRAPYFFLDIDTLGQGGVVRWVLMIVAVFLALAWLLVLLDRLLGCLHAPANRSAD